LYLKSCFQAKYDGDVTSVNKTMAHLQEENDQFLKQIEIYRSNLDKVQIQLEEKQNVNLKIHQHKFVFCLRLVYRAGSKRSLRTISCSLKY